MGFCHKNSQRNFTNPPWNNLCSYIRSADSFSLNRAQYKHCWLEITRKKRNIKTSRLSVRGAKTEEPLFWKHKDLNNSDEAQETLQESADNQTVHESCVCHCVLIPHGLKHLDSFTSFLIKPQSKNSQHGDTFRSRLITETVCVHTETLKVSLPSSHWRLLVSVHLIKLCEQALNPNKAPHWIRFRTGRSDIQLLFETQLILNPGLINTTWLIDWLVVIPIQRSLNVTLLE